MLVSIRTPADNARGPRYMEKALASIHQGGIRKSEIRLVYAYHASEVGLFLGFADAIKNHILDPLSAKYPACRFECVQLDETCRESSTCYAELCLSPDLFPILRHAQFEDLLNRSYEDPIDGLLKAIEPAQGVTARIEIAIRKASHRLARRAKRAVKRLDGPFFRRHFQIAEFYARRITRPWAWTWLWPLGLIARSREAVSAHTDATGSRLHDREDDVQAAADKIGGHLFEARVLLLVSAPSQQLARMRLQAMAGAFGALTRSRLATFRLSRVRFGIAKRHRRSFLLSAEELATIFHPPTKGIEADKLAATTFRELPPPPIISVPREGEGQCQIGRVLYRDDERLVVIAREDRLRHLHILGRTGVGKSTLLLNQIRSDIASGCGLCVIDPHGDLAAAVLASIPRSRTNDVILFDPADDEYSVAFNPLSCSDPRRRDLVADDVLSAFEKAYDLSDTPRLKDTLRNALYVLVEKGKTLLSLLLMLSDASYRENLTASIEDDVVRMFWQSEFQSWNDRYRTEALSAIQNKLRPFLLSRKLRSIVGQSGTSLHLREVMDEGKVLIVPLSKGKLGEVNVRLLGSLLVTSLQQAAMTRADIPEIERRDFFLYIDELHNFATPTFSSMLSEIRKYRVGLIGSHQFLEQLPEDTASALAGNTGSRIVFQTGPEDAERLAKLLSKYPDQVLPQDLMNLPKYTGVVQILIDGMPSNPFTIRTLPPAEITEDRTEAVRRASARRYAKPIEVAQKMIQREFGLVSEDPDREEGRRKSGASSRHREAIAA